MPSRRAAQCAVSDGWQQPQTLRRFL